jgi:cytochrome P450/NADPH-cytochrome P450 reductase
VLGAGNRQWRNTFQKFPRFLNDRLAELGAEPFYGLGSCDADGDFDAAAEAWAQGLWPVARDRFGAGEASGIDPEDDLLYTVETVNFAGADGGASLPATSPLHAQARTVTVLRNDELQSPDSDRSTRHLEIALPEGATYAAGDHLGVFPENPAALVNAAAQRCRLRLTDVVILRERAPSGDQAENRLPGGVPVTVQDLLTLHVDLAGPVTRKELRMMARRCPCPPEKAGLEALAADPAFKAGMLDARLSVLDLLERFQSIECDLALLLSMRPVLKPRYYSISSAPAVLPDRCSITVGVHGFASACGPRDGLCSHYLARCEPGSLVRVLVKDTGSTFRLPADPTCDVVLIGPGTGLAPLRGFIQERAALRAQGQPVGRTTLFFGCRRPDHDYLYRDELEGHLETGALSALHVAFSREEGRPKVYVQDRIREQARALWDALSGTGHVYICGDAKHMAPDVARAFVEVIRAEGGMTEAGAEARLEALKADGRYLQDVWAST